MFERLQHFLASLSGEDKPTFAADDPRVAVMALCIQVMEADGKVLDIEKKALRAHFRELYSVEASFGRSATLRLTRANKHYSKISIDHDSFCERVLGKIVADVKVREFGPRP